MALQVSLKNGLYLRALFGHVTPFRLPFMPVGSLLPFGIVSEPSPYPLGLRCLAADYPIPKLFTIPDGFSPQVPLSL